MLRGARRQRHPRSVLARPGGYPGRVSRRSMDSGRDVGAQPSSPGSRGRGGQTPAVGTRAGGPRFGARAGALHVRLRLWSLDRRPAGPLGLQARGRGRRRRGRRTRQAGHGSLACPVQRARHRRGGQGAGQNRLALTARPREPPRARLPSNRQRATACNLTAATPSAGPTSTSASSARLRHRPARRSPSQPHGLLTEDRSFDRRDTPRAHAPCAPGQPGQGPASSRSALGRRTGARYGRSGQSLSGPGWGRHAVRPVAGDPQRRAR